LSAALETRAATDWMPATRDDALHVLGASPDASIEAIRKIVDGLRQSWHPDLARSEDDRLVRERRMKLINVAWDVVQRTAAA
jgi:DnaJ-class molecular chaperone